MIDVDSEDLHHLTRSRYGVLKGTAIALLLGLGLLFVYMFYPRAAREEWHAKETESALELGRVYAWSLLWGRKERLLEMSAGPASQKIEGANLEELPIYGNLDRILDSWGIREGEQDEAFTRYIDILGPLVFTEEESGHTGRHRNLELLRFEKHSCFVVMTFAYRHSFEGIVGIPGKGKMLFAIAMKYCQPKASKPGFWVVFDYHYRGTLADYREWASKEGKRFADEEFAKPKRRLDMSKFKREMELLYEWGWARAKGQLDDVEGHYRLDSGNAH